MILYGIRFPSTECKNMRRNRNILNIGQELNTSTYNLARMNMFLHGISPENQNLRNGDTLDEDWPTGEETDFNMVLMNPPYSAKWSAATGFCRTKDSVIMEYWHRNQKQIMHSFSMACII